MNLIMIMIRCGNGDYQDFWSKVRSTTMSTYSKDLIFIALSLSVLDQLNKTLHT